MRKISFLINPMTGLLVLISSLSFGQENSLILFQDDFEPFTIGQQLVCQDSMNWDTWSGDPCDPVEDPYVSNTTAYSGTNSVWIQQGNDLVKPVPNHTYGKYSISFYLYIPLDYTASWGQLAAFYNPGSTEWGFTAKFDLSGNGYVSGGGSGTAFPFSYDTWQHNELIVDLNKDSAEYYFEGSRIYSWQWTLGIWGDTCARQLSLTDIMGSDWPNPDPSQWYLDDYVLERLDTIVGVEDFSVPTEFALEQNYPNPFNPTTIIKYQIPTSGNVTIKVNDILGNEVAKLVDDFMGTGKYEVSFDASSLASGVYIYRLNINDFVNVKKMILLK
jgi:hypothetical protein